MPRFSCLCGFSISLHSMPNEHEFDIVADTLREPLIDKLVSAHKQSPSSEAFERIAYQVHSHIATPGILTMVECPNCYRIAVFARALDESPMFWFQREQTSLSEHNISLHNLVEQLSAQDSS